MGEFETKMGDGSIRGERNAVNSATFLLGRMLLPPHFFRFVVEAPRPKPKDGIANER
jgi:hypothetical protein